MTITVVGKNSFLASALRGAPACRDWVFLSHAEAVGSAQWLENCHCLVNFAFDPYLARNAYHVDYDIDTKLAQYAASRAIHYIMISSRKVYGAAPEYADFHENSPLLPDSHYGHAKVEIERSLKKILKPDNLTILRASNIFGPELRRRSFFGTALTSLLQEGRIVYDFSPATRRDFFSVWQFGLCIAQVAKNPAAGIFNIGAGFGLECDLIARWLIEALGRGVLEVSDSAVRDGFSLDIRKIRSAYAWPAYTAEDIRRDCEQSLKESLKSLNPGF